MSYFTGSDLEHTTVTLLSYECYGTSKTAVSRFGYLWQNICFSIQLFMANRLFLDSVVHGKTAVSRFGCLWQNSIFLIRLLWLYSLFTPRIVNNNKKNAMICYISQ